MLPSSTLKLKVVHPSQSNTPGHRKYISEAGIVSISIMRVAWANILAQKNLKRIEN